MLIFLRSQYFSVQLTPLSNSLAARWRLDTISTQGGGASYIVTAVKYIWFRMRNSREKNWKVEVAVSSAQSSERQVANCSDSQAVVDVAVLCAVYQLAAAGVSRLHESAITEAVFEMVVKTLCVCVCSEKKQVQQVLWTRKGGHGTVVTAGHCMHAELTSRHALASCYSCCVHSLLGLC